MSIKKKNTAENRNDDTTNVFNVVSINDPRVLSQFMFHKREEASEWPE